MTSNSVDVSGSVSHEPGTRRLHGLRGQQTPALLDNRQFFSQSRVGVLLKPLGDVGHECPACR